MYPSAVAEKGTASANVPAPGLKVSDVTLTYQSKRGTRQALGPITIECEAGEFIAVIGPSGCGKSTLLKLASGLIRPTSGSIHLGDGEVVGPRKDVGIVFQAPTLLPWKTVRDNVVMPLRVLRALTPEGYGAADRLIELVGLKSSAQNYPHELSGGMQQRVGIARALINEPRLLLMDEPFAALDALTREHMMEELQAIWQRTRQSVLFITHSIPEAVFLADRVLVLSSGPGRIIHEELIRLPRPRDMAAAEFGEICNRLRKFFTR